MFALNKDIENLLLKNLVVLISKLGFEVSSVTILLATKRGFKIWLELGKNLSNLHIVVHDLFKSLGLVSHKNMNTQHKH